MKKIRIKCGCYALVDDDLYPILNQFKWRNAHGYAVRSIYHPHLKGSRSWGMHSDVLPPKPDVVTDHIDGNRLNNQRANLRYATRCENKRNSRLNSNNTSGYKGVSWLGRDKRWMAWIHVDGQNRYIGSFTSEVEAAYHYNLKAAEIFGEFAWFNPLPDEFVPSEGIRVKRRSDSSLPFVGIRHDQYNKAKWNATITFEGNKIHLGTYTDPAEAAYVYDQVALQLLGSKSRLNFL